MNTGRVLAGGLAAGVVMNAVGFGVNEALLGDKWRAAAASLNANLSTPAIESSSMIGWIATSFLLGIVVIWIYAAIRPRFGPGAGTAAIAAVVTWLATLQMGLSMWFTGLYSMHLVFVSVSGVLVGLLIGGQVGAWLYKE